MSVPGDYLCGLRLGRCEDRAAVAAATGISEQRQRLIEEHQAVPSYRERRCYARFFGFACVDELDRTGVAKPSR